MSMDQDVSVMLMLSVLQPVVEDNGADATKDLKEMDIHAQVRQHLYSNIGITHVFSCSNICRVPRMLLEHKAYRPSDQASSDGPGKC